LSIGSGAAADLGLFCKAFLDRNPNRIRLCAKLMRGGLKRMAHFGVD
jgi:hypothetical protein